MASPTPDENIQQVIAQCPSCSEETAKHCLELHGNSVDRATTMYTEVEEFLPPDPTDPADPTPDSDDARSKSSHDDNSQVDIDTLDESQRSQHDSVDEGHSRIPKVSTLPVPDWCISNGPRDTSVFELRGLLAAIQAGQFDVDSLRKYLGHYDRDNLRKNVNADIDGYPAMFYVASTNNVDIIREWIKHGGDPNVTWGTHAFPLIVFSIINGGQTMYEASKTLATLLRFGADPRAIPKAFYDPYYRNLPDGGPIREELDDLDLENERWCTAEVRSQLSEALSLSQRYDLYRSSKVKSHSGRRKQLLSRQGTEEVLGLHQMMIAQPIAMRWVQEKLLVYLARQKKRPLILVFAGPSGHGKTELAERFGYLMSLELCKVDCTTLKQEHDLFGPRAPYSGFEEGSGLNNFLVRNQGERSIVFMDEFEKTNREIHNALLLPFQDGGYEDRRNGHIIDCSKTIWILATNQLDDHIQAFCNNNEQALSHSTDEKAQDKLVGRLCRQLRREFIGHFGAPLAGRITEILPFLIFSAPESAVFVHKTLMALETEVTRGVRLSLNKEEDVYVGNISIRIKNDATVCVTIANEEYDKETGARSIFQAVERIVEDPLISQYLENGDSFDENQPIAHFVIDVDVDGEIEVRLLPS